MDLHCAATTKSGASVKTAAAAATANMARESAGSCARCCLLVSRVFHLGHQQATHWALAYCCGFLCVSSGAVIVVEWISALTIDAKDSVKTVEARKFACTIVRNFGARTATCGFITYVQWPILVSLIPRIHLKFKTVVGGQVYALPSQVTMPRVPRFRLCRKRSSQITTGAGLEREALARRWAVGGKGCVAGG